ncbi:MAG TPA: hypothetical protein DCL77_18745 [Prolixibacteraceae bacterium]|jgi:hypothetical protein|nr:hypothetical protein [Prolixibacteraceae bacterium]
MKKLLHLLWVCIFLVIIAGMSFAHQVTIHGKVVDVSGGSLPGVSVSVKGTTSGTITSTTGTYTLSNQSVG